MARTKKPRMTAVFKHSVPVEVRRPRFKLSTAIAEIDPARLSRKARVEIEVGRFGGDGCGQVVTAIVKKGTVAQLRVEPCKEVQAMRNDPALRSLVTAARRQIGVGATPGKWRPIPFAAFQSSAAALIIQTITCIQICIYGHCIVCCTLPQGGFFCGRRIIIHTP